MSLSDFLRRRIGLRRGLILSFHVFLYALAYVGAFLIRFDFTIPAGYSKHIIVGGVLIVFLRIAAGFPFRLYGGVLKYAGIGDLVNIVKAMTAATAAFVVAVVIIGLQNFPRSIFVIDWAGSIALVGGLRFGLRVVREALTATAPGEEGGRKRVLILGAGDAGEALVRDLQRGYRDRYDVVGFLDDNRSKQGLRIHGVPVLGPLSYLGDFAARYQVDEVIVAIPTASGKTMRTIFDICKIAGVRFKTVPGMDQLIDGRVTVSQVRDVAIDDLLGREPVKLEEGLLRRFLHEKSVNPTSVMGASKRVAEIYVQSLSADSKTKFSAVRFGNVLGSTGSVIPIFKEQIQRRGPLTSMGVSMHDGDGWTTLADSTLYPIGAASYTGTKFGMETFSEGTDDSLAIAIGGLSNESHVFSYRQGSWSELPATGIKADTIANQVPHKPRPGQEAARQGRAAFLRGIRGRSAYDLRAARPQGHLQEGPRRRDQGLHRHRRPLRAAPKPRAGAEDGATGRRRLRGEVSRNDGKGRHSGIDPVGRIMC